MIDRRWHSKKACSKNFFVTDKEDFGRSLTVLDCDGRCNPEQKGHKWSRKYFEFISVIDEEQEVSPVKFRLGGLYWHAPSMSYMECTRKSDDIVELSDLSKNEKKLVYDGDFDFEDVTPGPLKRHIDYESAQVVKMKSKLMDKENYLAKLNEVWPNVGTVE